MRTITRANRVNRQLADINMLPMSLGELRSVKGGDYIDDLFDQIFNLSLLPTNGSNMSVNIANSIIITNFKDSFREIASTVTGLYLFEQIATTSEDIILDPDASTLPQDALAGYRSSDNHLILNPVLINPTAYGKTFDVVAHELYHGFSDIVEFNLNDDSGDVKSEINAELFAYMTALEYDKQHNLAKTDLNSRYYFLEKYIPSTPLNMTDPLTYPQTWFYNAWTDIIENGNLSVANYNSLIENFTYTDRGSGYATLTSQIITDFNTSQSVDELFNLIFRNSYYPSNGGNNNGGGGGGSTFDPTQTYDQNTLGNYYGQMTTYYYSWGSYTGGGSSFWQNFWENLWEGTNWGDVGEGGAPVFV